MASLGSQVGPEAVPLRPICSLTIAVCTGIWFYLWNYDVNIEKFGYQYTKVVRDKEIWRIVSASYAHVHPLHLVFNMASLWNAGSMEEHFGSLVYAKFSFLLVVFSMAVVTLAYYFAIHQMHRDYYSTVYSLGYSCVVFGWMMIQCEVSQGSMYYFGIHVPARLAPFMALIITQLIVPNASFIGHLSGIIVGEMIAWHLFDWFVNPVFIAVLILGLGVAVWSFYTRMNTTRSARTWTPIADDSEDSTEMRVVNGVLVRGDSV
mmetsp:Transcript_5404/g.7975  ORF Transcript_5404/g.7975 Transcript_5404/m.7975 type:complete len:262 (-) Transcript_5404:71-856(-)